MRGFERRVRVLEDDLHAPAELAQLARRQADSIARPSNRIVPDGRLEQPRARAGPVVDLPHPDSPTSPSVSRAVRRERLTSSTACTTPLSLSPKYAAPHREVLHEVLDLEERRRRRSCGAVRRPPPRLDAGELGELVGPEARRPVPGVAGTTSSTGALRAAVLVDVRTPRMRARSPRGSAARLGGVPGIVAAARAGRRRGAAASASRPSVYGWRGAVEDLVERPLLDDPTRVHHDDPVGHAGHDPEVVGDEQHRGVGLGLRGRGAPRGPGPGS